MLYLGYVLLRYVLICNLEVSFTFHLTFLQLNMIKMFTLQSWKLLFTLLSAIFFGIPITRTLDNSNLFSISLEGSSCRKSTVFKRSLASLWQNRVLSHFQFAGSFYKNTFSREQFMKSYGVDKKSTWLLKIIHYGRDLEVQRFPKPRSKLDFV